MNRKTCRRKTKRIVNQLRRKLKHGSHLIDCRNHPCIVTQTYWTPGDLYGNSIQVESLVDKTPNSCSLLYCRPEPIEKQNALERADFMKKHGTIAYHKKYDPAFDEEGYKKLSLAWKWGEIKPQ